MVAQNREAANQSGGIVEFFWNVVGGAMISAMLAGVIYVLFGMIGAHISGTDQYWELVYLKWYFIVVLAIYLIMPTILANVVGFIFGSKSRASGTKPKV